MKKILFTIFGLGLAVAANAEYRADQNLLVVYHTTEMAMDTELAAALDSAGLAATSIEKLKVVCPIPENHSKGTELYWATSYNADKGEKEDCGCIRKAMPQLKVLDVTDACFRYNTTGEVRGGGFFMSGMQKLEEVFLPEGLTGLGGDSFRNCKALKTVHFPQSFHSIGKRAFAACTSLQMAEIPETVTVIADEAFYCTENSNGGKVPLTNLKCTILPEGLTEVGSCAFQSTKCAFSVLPPNLKIIKANAFREAPVTFSKFPESVETLEKEAFILCDGITNFELSGILLTNVPDRTFYINTQTIKRTFTSRGMQPPTVALMSSWEYGGSFGRIDNVLKNTTFLVLKDAYDNYKDKEPWNKMNLQALTTPVEVSIVGTGADVAINHQHYADKVFEAGTHDIYEGTHEWTFTPNNSSYYITSIYYEETEPVAAPRKRVITADDNEDDAEEAEEPVSGKQTLYQAEGTPAVGFIPVKVSVPVTSKAGKLSVEYAFKSGSTTGIDDINAEAAFVRNGNVISVTEGTATLYDLTGKAITTAAEIDMTNLNTGVYILRCGAQSLKIAR